MGEIQSIPDSEDPHLLVWPFVSDARRYRDKTTMAFREFAIRHYFKIFGRYPTESMSNMLIYNRVAYELQMQGCKNANKTPCESVINNYHSHRQEEEAIMEAEKVTQPTEETPQETPDKTSEQKPTGRQLSATAYRRKLIMDNHASKLTDDRIVASIKEKFPDKNMTTSVQWARSDLIRNHKRYGFTVDQINERAHRFDLEGKNITKFNKKRNATTSPAESRPTQEAPAETLQPTTPPEVAPSAPQVPSPAELPQSPVEPPPVAQPEPAAAAPVEITDPSTTENPDPATTTPSTSVDKLDHVMTGDGSSG